MREIRRLLSFAFWGAAVWAVGVAMAAEASPPVRLRMPFVDALAQDGVVVPRSDDHRDCRVSGEQGLRIGRETFDPCLTADAVAGGVCFDRLGLGALRARRAMLPENGQHCEE